MKPTRLPFVGLRRPGLIESILEEVWVMGRVIFVDAPKAAVRGILDAACGTSSPRIAIHPAGIVRVARASDRRRRAAMKFAGVAFLCASGIGIGPPAPAESALRFYLLPTYISPTYRTTSESQLERKSRLQKAVREKKPPAVAKIDTGEDSRWRVPVEPVADRPRVGRRVAKTRPVADTAADADWFVRAHIKFKKTAWPRIDAFEDRKKHVGGPADSTLIPDPDHPIWDESVPDQEFQPNFPFKFRGIPVVKGAYLRPVVGGYKSQGVHGNNGVDLAHYCGTPVLAAAPGIVHSARPKGWNGGYGRVVTIDHPNGKRSLYAHLSRVTVQPGQVVRQGMEIGRVGSSGNSTGCHLHFEIRGGRNPF